MSIFKAEEKDAFELFYLHEISSFQPFSTSVKKLIYDINSNNKLWLIYRNANKIEGGLFFLLDDSQKLVKLERVLLRDQLKTNIFFELLNFSLTYFNKNFDLLYSTTRGVSLELQSLTIDAGFKVLGIFPNAIGFDKTRINGLTAYYFGDSLKKRFCLNSSIHKIVEPIFELVSRQFGFETPNVLTPTYFEREKQNIELELIKAPKFVSNRFANLSRKKSSAIHFYPFQTPNALIVSPNEEIEIFVKIIPEIRFAAIIGEKLEESVDPISLYESVLNILNENGVAYVELINDAFDINGIDSLIRSGFLPCAYIPALKLVEKERRDYIVLSRAFEKRVTAFSQIHPLYLDFYNEYVNLEEKQLLGTLLS